MNTTTTMKIRANGETFTKGTYNGISILIRDKDGYINGSKLGNENRRARDFMKTSRFEEICKFWQENWSARFLADPNLGSKYLLSNVKNELKGTYVHPDIVHFIAEWIYLKYAFTVADIMNSINNKVHEELQEKQLQDTVENAKPIFKKVVNEIVAPNNEAYEQQYAWGVRGSSTKLDYWEREELYSDIKAYNNLKEQFAKAQEKINSWSCYAEEYFPGLMQ